MNKWVQGQFFNWAANLLSKLKLQLFFLAVFCFVLREHNLLHFSKRARIKLFEKNPIFPAKYKFGRPQKKRLQKRSKKHFLNKLKNSLHS